VLCVRVCDVTSKEECMYMRTPLTSHKKNKKKLRKRFSQRNEDIRRREERGSIVLLLSSLRVCVMCICGVVYVCVCAWGVCEWVCAP